MATKDELGDFAAKKVAESDARMAKINPKGRKLDKNGNPIITKEELKKSGLSLRDFLNKERGLTRRKDKMDPMQAPAVKGKPMPKAKDPRAQRNAFAKTDPRRTDRDTQNRVMRDEMRKRKNAENLANEEYRQKDVKATEDLMRARERNRSAATDPRRVDIPASRSQPAPAPRAAVAPTPARNTSFGGALEDAARARRKAREEQAPAMPEAKSAPRLSREEAVNMAKFPFNKRRDDEDRFGGLYGARGMKSGGAVKKAKASKPETKSRGNGIAQRGKTRGRMC